VGGGPKTEEDFPQNKVSQIKMDATGEGGRRRRWLTLGRFWVFGLQQYSHACLICSACTRSRLEEKDISSNGAYEIGGAKGYSGFFELVTRIRRDVRAA